MTQNLVSQQYQLISMDEIYIFACSIPKKHLILNQTHMLTKVKDDIVVHYHAYSEVNRFIYTLPCLYEKDSLIKICIYSGDKSF